MATDESEYLPYEENIWKQHFKQESDLFSWMLQSHCSENMSEVRVTWAW